MTSSGASGSIGETEAAVLLAGEDILSQDNIPNENQQIDCFSCGESMTGLYCHSCGQKNDNYRRSILSLLTEAFASIFSLENRMWRTWKSLLLKPGKVSREFADGKRTNWTSPVRVYLALSIILFGYMSLTETRIFSLRTDIVPKAEFEGPVDTLNDASVRLKYDFGFFRRQAEIDQLNQNTDFIRVARLMKGVTRQAFDFDGDLNALGITPSDELLKSSQSWPTPIGNDADTSEDNPARKLALTTYRQKVQNAVESYNELLSTSNNPETIADRIIQTENNDEVFDLAAELELSANDNLKLASPLSVSSVEQTLSELGLTRAQIHTLPVETNTGINLNIGEGSINGVELSQNDIQKLADRILRNPALLNDGISKYLPRIMFLMMPFAALIGLIFIRDRKTALLYDHLVHATYIHAVTFALLLILILVAQWTPFGRGNQIFLLAVAIYLPLSAKGMFQRGWFKTIFASYTIALFYGLAMFIIITILTARSITEALKVGHSLI